MEIYEALKNDHQKLKGILDQLVKATDEKERTSLIAQVRDALVPHARAEEAVFYNSLREFERAKEKVSHSFKEHMQAETLLRTLQVKDKVAGNWEKTATELKQALEHHIQEEEGEIFPLAQQFFTGQEATMMTKAFNRLKEETMDEGFMKTSLDMVVNMMPPRFTERFRNFNPESHAS